MKRHVVASIRDELRSRETERDSRHVATESALKRELEAKTAETDALKEQVRDLSRLFDQAATSRSARKGSPKGKKSRSWSARKIGPLEAAYGSPVVSGKRAAATYLEAAAAALGT